MTLLEQIYLKVVISQEMDGNCIFSYQSVVDMSPTTFQVSIHQDRPWMHRHEWCWWWTRSPPGPIFPSWRSSDALSSVPLKWMGRLRSSILAVLKVWTPPKSPSKTLKFFESQPIIESQDRILGWWSLLGRGSQPWFAGPSIRGPSLDQVAKPLLPSCLNLNRHCWLQSPRWFFFNPWFYPSHPSPSRSCFNLPIQRVSSSWKPLWE